MNTRVAPSLLMAFPTIKRPFIVFMTLATETHRQWFSLPGNSLFLDITMTKGTYLVDTLNRHAFIFEYEASQVFFVSKMHEVRKIVNLLPSRRFILFPGHYSR